MRKLWMVLGLVFVVGGLLISLNFWLEAPSEEDQIKAVLARGEAAVERRDLGAALACVSTDYSDPAGLDYRALRLQAMQTFAQAEGYEVAVDTSGIDVNGDTAVVYTHVSVTALVEGGSYEAFVGELTIELRKEASKRCLVIPTRVWRVTSISPLPTAEGYQAVSQSGRTCRHNERQVVHVALNPVAVPCQQPVAGRPIVGKAYVRE